MNLPVSRETSGAPLGRDGFNRKFPVSRETLERLDAYLALLVAWNPRINLVGASTLADPWRRHILDSAQILPHIPPGPLPIFDLGSGAGLPGLVLAILGVPGIHLIESDQRKCAFLREAARITATRVEIHPVRAETCSESGVTMVISRALASLPNLLELAAGLIGPHSICAFLKGQGVEEELTQATKAWKMTPRLLPSRSDPRGVLLILEALERLAP